MENAQSILDSKEFEDQDIIKYLGYNKIDSFIIKIAKDSRGKYNGIIIYCKTANEYNREFWGETHEDVLIECKKWISENLFNTYDLIRK